MKANGMKLKKKMEWNMKKIDFLDALKYLSVAITAILGTQAVDSVSGQSNDARLAVLEEKVKNVENAMPEIITTLRSLDKKTDSLIIISQVRK